MSNTVNVNSLYNETSGYTPKIQQSNYQPGSNNVSNDQAQQHDESGTEDLFIHAIEKANHLSKGTTECQFSIHQGTKQIMIKLIDPQTKQVIKEIPSEKVLDMVADMCELAGLFVDEKR